MHLGIELLLVKLDSQPFLHHLHLVVDRHQAQSNAMLPKPFPARIEPRQPLPLLLILNLLAT